MSIRRKLALVAAVVLVISVTAYGTMAYLTATGTAHNIITAGGVTIQLLDKTRGANQAETPIQELDDFNDRYPGGMAVMPGSEASKVVAVAKAEESADCWIRVRLDQTLYSSAGEAMTGYADKITLVLNTEDWTDGGDGWYYCNAPLTAEDSVTAPLLTQVNFAGPAMGNEYQGATYAIDVTAQAVQTANNPVPEGGDVTDVAGWPGSETPEPSGTPEPTETPEPSETPEVTETPEPSETPAEPGA